MSNVFVSTGFSGHGFKYASAIGRMVADLMLNGKSELPLEMFRLSRFSAPVQ
jgi:sarcosine oxidase